MFMIQRPLATLFMICLIFTAPFVALAQQGPVNFEAKAAAEHDARSDVNELLWFGAGCLLSGGTLLALRILGESQRISEGTLLGTACLLNGAGIAGVYLYQPAPPPSRLLGKSAEYLNFYADAYQTEAGRIQSRWATVGYISGGLAILGILMLEAEFRD